MEDSEHMVNFETRLLVHADAVESLLNCVLGDTLQDGEIARPKRLLNAMRYGVLNGGKRLRPFLVMESAALFESDPHVALRVAAALECVHCYSLIHDDLPAMDDDDLRRGQPTVHRAFDEAHAILAGDSLLTLAFDILVDRQTNLQPEVQIELVRMLARAAGLGGMAGGQALDLSAQTMKPDEAGIITLQAMKTGALFRFACEAGAVTGNASSQMRTRLAEFGSAIGLAFQISDDLLDVTADVKHVGKATGKDAGRGKGTLVNLHGIEWAKQQLSGLTAQAVDLLVPFGERGQSLADAALFISARQR
jgi:farnesyl diphosphate synthase